MTAARSARHRACERGMTLVVVLILLAGLGMLAVVGVRSGVANIMAVGNTQSRQEALAAAQTAIERTISSPAFAVSAAAVAASPIPVDVDGDGRTDQTVTLAPAPRCYNFRVVKMSELDDRVAADVVCMYGNAGRNAGIDSSSLPSGDSMCADSEWNVRAVVAAPDSGASAAVNQGVVIRGAVTDAANSCP